MCVLLHRTGYTESGSICHLNPHLKGLQEYRVMQDQATSDEQASFNPALRLIKTINESHLTFQDLFSFFPLLPLQSVGLSG